MKLLMRDEAKGREHTIFVTIFSALMVMLAIVVMLMASATAISGVTLQLDENAVDILDKQVENRAGYIQDQLQQAQELTDLSTYINETAQQMLDDETLSLKTLDSSSSDSLPLLLAAAPRMLETLRSKRITGIFLILNTHDFTGRTSGDRLPCVYLRDLDPDAAPSVVNSDILLECAPSELVQTFDIATDKAWSPALQYLDGEQDVFYVRPFQTAYEDVERIGAANYGRWTTLPYKLLGDDREAIAYAQPLILDDGTVYGVLGVELLESYMDTKLPWNELQNDHHGSYLLASTTSELKGEVLDLHVTSNTGEQSVPLRNAKWELTLRRSNNYWYYMMDGRQQIASIRQISLYSRNAPFSGERWLLVGVVGKNDLFSFSQSMTKLMGLAVLLTMGIGLACAFLVSFGLAQPVAQLSKELVDAQEQRKAVPEFSRTGIRELDQLAESIVTLSTDNYKAAVAERNRIEHERDYDALTGLYSRQAFFRVCGELFEKPDTLRHAALMMTDLDNLKTINDTYGYDWGDNYLRQSLWPSTKRLCRSSGRQRRSVSSRKKLGADLLSQKNIALCIGIVPVQRAIFCLSLLNEADEEGAEHGGEDAGHGDGQAAHGTFDLTHLQSFAGTYGMGRGADADALCDGVGDVEDLADHLGQQVARDAGEDDDGTRQGRDAAQLSGDIHADGRGDGLRQEGGVLLPSEVQCEGQSQSAAQAHQSTHGDARDDGGGILLQQVPFFI